MDLDRIRACIEINELPSFALVQSICPGELISSVAPALSCLSLGCVLVGANISHLNSAVVTPAAKPPTAAPPTPKPRQSLLTMLTSGVKMTATATARRKSAAKAAVSDLPAGQALKSASLPVKSKKRKHRHSIEEVGRSDNAVGDWQQRADAEKIVDNIFATTNDNPERMGATLKRVISHPALQPHLPTEVTRRHSEEQRVAMRLGTNFKANYKAIAAKGPAATCAELDMRRSGMQMVLSGNEAENKEIRQTARYLGKASNHDVIGRQSREKEDAVVSGDLTRHATKRRKTRCDATSGDPIFEEIWHHFTDQVKGQRGTRRKYAGSEVTKLVARVCGRESAKRRTRTSFIPCLLLALSLARRPGRLPCLLRLCSP